MNTQSGFTLIELMVTLAVGIVILAIGLPSIMTMVSSNQAAGYANDLVGAIRLARSEAVKRADVVTICPRSYDPNDPEKIECTNATGKFSTDWNNGWIVFIDEDGDSHVDTNAGDIILRNWLIPEDEHADLAFDNVSPSAIRFDSAGGNASGAPIQFTFQKSDCRGNQARQITVSIMGRATLDHVTCRT
jgi:type IV fimbrial biogenesis protein FimT